MREVESGLGTTSKEKKWALSAFRKQGNIYANCGRTAAAMKCSL